MEYVGCVLRFVVLFQLNYSGKLSYLCTKPSKTTWPLQVITDSASCTKQTTDTFASHVPLNDIPAFGSTVQREKQVHSF